MPFDPCVSCGMKVDAATTLGGPELKPGDISVCFYCGHLSALGDDGKLRPLTDAEMHAVAGDPRILEVQAARAAVRKKNEQ